jgi:hypothetical protein
MFRFLFVLAVAYAAVEYGPDLLPPSPLSVITIVALVSACVVMALVTVLGEPKWGN